MSDLTTLPPLLIPRPAHLSLTHTPPHPSTPSSLPPTTRSDPSLPHPDCYRLTIADTVTIAHNSDAALAYAHTTLAQLRTQYGDTLPQLEILDYPAIPTRGIMLDISRDRIPTMPEFHRLIPELASLKLNHLQLYTEHTFAYTGHEEVWQGWNPITPAELLEIQTLCSQHAIELAANQNCLGHLTNWLKHERYAPLAETHGEWIFDRFKRSGPFSLCPSDPGSIELVRDLLDQLLPLFQSPLANVGCDETYDVGQGRSAEEVARRGKAPVYFEFLGRVFDAVRAHNKRPMFWADVALNHPDHIHRVPDDAIALAWGYEADTDFDKWCDLLCSAGKTTWVCPGTSSWRSITGRTSVRRANCQAAADAAAKHHLPGYLITDWGDSGHQQVWPIALIAIAEAADAAWNAGREPEVTTADSGPLSRPRRERAGERAPSLSSSQTLEQAVSLHCFADPTLSSATWLADLGDIDKDLRPRAGRDWFEGKGQPLHNASVHFADLAEPWGSHAMDLTAEDFYHMKDQLTQLVSQPYSSRPMFRREYLLILERTALAVCRAAARRPPEVVGNPKELIQLAQEVQRLHARLWPYRSRPGRGLEDSLAHDQRIIDELRNL